MVERVKHELLRLASEPFQVSVAGSGVTARLAWSATDAAIQDAVATANPAWEDAALAEMLFLQIVDDMALSCEAITGRAQRHDAECKVFLCPSRFDSRTELSPPLSAEGANNDVCRCMPMRCSPASQRWRRSW